MKNNKMLKITPFIGVIVGIFVGMLLLAITGNGFFTLPQTLFDVISTPKEISPWLMKSSIYLLTGISVAYAYRTGMFNIGAEGQFIMGMIASAAVGIYLDMPFGIHALVALFSGALFGALFAYIPAILRTNYNVSEVVTTIMLNWVAFYLLNYLVTDIFPAVDAHTEPIAQSAKITLGDTSMHLGIIIAIIALITYWYVLDKTKVGYEMKAVGYNPIASMHAGISDKKTAIKSFMSAGSFSGIAGAIYTLGEVDYLSTIPTFLNYGFDGITVAFLGQMNPIGLLFSSLLIGLLRQTGVIMSYAPNEIIDIVIGLILLFVIITPIIIKKRGGKNV